MGISVAGLFKILRLPISFLVAIVKFYTIGLPFRKYKNHLKQCLKLVLFRASLSLSIPDAVNLDVFSNKFLLNSIIGTKHSSIIKDLPGFGERYDRHSFWIVKQPDRKPTDPVIIYLHGGGYFLQTQPAQIESNISLYKLLDPDVQKKVSILILDYTLVCYEGSSLPFQLSELHTTYKNLTVRDKSSNIILLGDSAGGHFSVTYTQYLKKLNRQKGPDRQEQTQLIYPKAFILISPWVNMIPTSEHFSPGRSYYESHERDMVSFKAFVDKSSIKYIFGENFNIATTDLTISPSKNPRSIKDWDNIPAFHGPDSNILIIAGEDESFRDDILEFADFALGVPLSSKLQFETSADKLVKKSPTSEFDYIREPSNGKGRLRVFVEPLGVHDSFFFFENHLLSLIKYAEKKGRKIDINKLADAEFYGTKRVVPFVNEVVRDIA